MRYIFVWKGSNHSHKNAKRQSLKRLTNHFHTNTNFSFFRAKTSIENIEHRLKSKLAWAVCTEYEVKLKNWTGAMTTAKN